MTARKSEANRGRAWEHELDGVHALYRGRGVYVEANPRRWRILRHVPGGMLCVPEAQSPPDYTALADGVPLLFDAKSCKATGKAPPRWPY